MLEIQGAYHVLESDVPFMGTLAVADAYHEVEADDCRLSIPLKVQSAYHTVQSLLFYLGGLANASHNHFSGIRDSNGVYQKLTLKTWGPPATTLQPDGASYPVLPNLKLEISAAEHISTPAETLILPSLSLSAQMGSQVRGTLSVITASISMTGTLSMGLARNLPALTGTMRGGSNISIDLPALTLEIAASNNVLGQMVADLPPMAGAATMIFETLGYLDQSLPPLDLAIGMSGIGAGSLLVSLPPLMLAATASMNPSGALAGILPIVIGVGTGYRSSLEVNGILPALLIQTIGTGGSAYAEISLTDHDRFAGYILRHVR